MEAYIGIGFVILCLAILVFIVALVNYSIRLDKKELDIGPNKTTSSSNPEG